MKHKGPALLLVATIMLLLSCSKESPAPTPAPPITVAKKEMNVAYGNHPLQQMDVYFPSGYSAETPVVFLLHGGGFYEGSKDQYADKAELFCKEGFVVVNANYRLIDSTGLFANPPQHINSAVKIPDVLQDMASAIAYYKSHAAGWGVGHARMYMTGHSAGAITSLLYLYDDFNTNGDIRAAGNWGGTTDFSKACDTTLDYGLYTPYVASFREMVYRWTGFEPVPQSTLAYMAFAAYWLANNKGGRPTISVMPEVNDFFPEDSPVSTKRNTRNYHTLLTNAGVPNRYLELPGENHGFEALPDSWQKTIHATAEFFKAN